MKYRFPVSGFREEAQGARRKGGLHFRKFCAYNLLRSILSRVCVYGDARVWVKGSITV
jgi:hypothetical protein